MATEQLNEVKPLTFERFREINEIINEFKREFVDANAGLLILNGISDPDDPDYIRTNSSLMGSSSLISSVLLDLMMTDEEWKDLILNIVAEFNILNR